MNIIVNWFLLGKNSRSHNEINHYKNFLFQVPYDQIDPESALTTSFVYRGANAAKYFVAFGAISSLTASLLGSQFPMARIIYAMSHDGLLFR